MRVNGLYGARLKSFHGEEQKNDCEYQSENSIGTPRPSKLFA